MRDPYVREKFTRNIVYARLSHNAKTRPVESAGLSSDRGKSLDVRDRQRRVRDS
jgi:hypothetical protein